MPKSNQKFKKKQYKIYLDHASATPIESSVFLKMIKFSKENFANSSAIHNSGVKIKKILEEIRKEVAEFLGSHSNEVIFTSGATESNNLAILGVVNKNTQFIFPHIIVTNIEHASVLEVCKYLEKTKKAEVTYVEVENNGIVNPKKIRKALKVNTILVSVNYANNEIGTIQPLREIAKEIRHYKKKISMKNSSSRLYPIFHTDATQAINYLPISVEKLGIDLLSFNSAKIYGPKGVGVLYIKRNTSIQKIIFGGDQEFIFRPGTENVANILGLKEALVLTNKIRNKESARLIKLRNYFLKELKKVSKTIFGGDFTINGSLKNRLPNNINITIPKIPSDLLVIELSARGVEASSKSACKTGDNKASHVIKAINKPARPHENSGAGGNIKEIDGSLRFSLGRSTTKKDIDYTIQALSKVLNKLKKWYD